MGNKIFCNNMKIDDRLTCEETEKWDQEVILTNLLKVKTFFTCEDEQHCFFFVVICHDMFFEVCGY